jgi:16S rRNA (cytosine1407-C5)-methyltransferase
MTIQYPVEFRKLLDSLAGKESNRITSLIDIRPYTTFRFNPLKHTVGFQKDLLRVQGFRFDEVEQLRFAARLKGNGPSIGRSLSHFAGHIYIQDLASMLPVVVLNPKEGERILDLCAAPGSKTTQLAASMNNRGLIVANDVSGKRLKSLIFNLRRTGVKNAVVCKGFGEQYGNLYFEFFQRVLVDPPCSALGTLHKSPEALSWWSPNKSEKLAGIQLRLLSSGLKALRPGGVLTYSTCTITPFENEQVIDQVLKRFPVELEQIDLRGLRSRPALANYQGQHYSADLSKAIRIYPWDNQSEGFFIARLRKTGSFGERREEDLLERGENALTDGASLIEPVLDNLSESYGLPVSAFVDDYFSLQQNLFCSSSTLKDFPLSHLFVKAGLPVARFRGDETLLTTEGTHLFGHAATKRIVQLSDLRAVEGYVNRETLPSPLRDYRQVLVHYRDLAIGHGVSHSGKLLSRFPRTGWRFNLSAGDSAI